MGIDQPKTIILHSISPDALVAADLITIKAISLLTSWGLSMGEDEFQVNTPKKDGGKKKKEKYGWMDEKKEYEEKVLGKWPATQKAAPRSLDAIFIAPTIGQAMHYRRALNYDPKTVKILTHRNYERALSAMEPDDDLPVYLCGSWLDEDVDATSYYQLDDVIHYLNQRGFDYVEVPEIG